MLTFVISLGAISLAVACGIGPRLTKEVNNSASIVEDFWPHIVSLRNKVILDLPYTSKYALYVKNSTNLLTLGVHSQQVKFLTVCNV